MLPALEKEVNEGQNFAPLRQVYSGMILAAWYKRALKESLLGKIYANKAKVKGVDQNPKNNEAIYQRYLQAYKKGVFNYIKEDTDKLTNQPVPRKYFSGGAISYSDPVQGVNFDRVVHRTRDRSIGDGAMSADAAKRQDRVVWQANPTGADKAMLDNWRRSYNEAMTLGDLDLARSILERALREYPKDKDNIRTLQGRLQIIEDRKKLGTWQQDIAKAINNGDWKTVEDILYNVRNKYPEINSQVQRYFTDLRKNPDYQKWYESEYPADAWRTREWKTNGNNGTKATNDGANTQGQTKTRESVAKPRSSSVSQTLYEVLGVSRTDTADDIRRAYRRLAMRYHPDLNSNDPEASKKFNELSSAHAILIDPKKRQFYDQKGYAPGPGDLAMLTIDFKEYLTLGDFSELLETYSNPEVDEDRLIEDILNAVTTISNQWKRPGQIGGHQGEVGPVLDQVITLVMDRFAKSDKYVQQKIINRILKKPAVLTHCVFEHAFKGANGPKAVNELLDKILTDDVEYRLLEAQGPEGQKLAEQILASAATRVFYHLWFLNAYSDRIPGLYAATEKGQLTVNPVSEADRLKVRSSLNDPKIIVLRIAEIQARIEEFTRLSEPEQRDALVELKNEIVNYRKFERSTEVIKFIGWSAFFDLGFSNPVRDTRTLSNFSYIDMAFFRQLGAIELTYDGYVPFDPSKRSVGEYLEEELEAEKLLAQVLGVTVTIHGPFLGHLMKGGNTLQRPIDFPEAAIEQVVGAKRAGKRSVVYHMPDVDKQATNIKAYADFFIGSYKALFDDAKGDAKLKETERGTYNPQIKIQLENYFALDQGLKFPTAGEFMDHWEAIGEALAQQARAGNQDARGALQYLFTLLLDSAHYNLSNREDPYVSAYIVAKRAMAFGQRMIKEFNFGADYYRGLVGELHVNQNIGLMGYFPGFSADIHSRASTTGPIANEQIIALFFAFGFEPIVTLEQLQEFDQNDWQMAKEGISLGQRIYAERNASTFEESVAFQQFAEQDASAILGSNVQDISWTVTLKDAYFSLMYLFKQKFATDTGANRKTTGEMTNHLLRRKLQAPIGGFAYSDQEPRNLPDGIQYVSATEINRNTKYFPKTTITVIENDKPVIKQVSQLFRQGIPVVEEDNPYGDLFIVRAPVGQTVAGYVQLDNGRRTIEIKNGTPVGEIALLGAGVRTAHVYLLPGTSLMGFSESAFKRYMEIMPDFRDLLTGLSHRRLTADIEAKSAGKNATEGVLRSLDVSFLLNLTMKGKRVFHNMTGDELARIAEVIRPMDLKKGETFIRRGQKITDLPEEELALFFVQQGDVIVRLADGTQIPLQAKKDQETILLGEMAFFSGERTADVTVTSDVIQIYGITRKDVLLLLNEIPNLVFALSGVSLERSAVQQKPITPETQQGLEAARAAFSSLDGIKTLVEVSSEQELDAIKKTLGAYIDKFMNVYTHSSTIDSDRDNMRKTVVALIRQVMMHSTIEKRTDFNEFLASLVVRGWQIYKDTPGLIPAAVDTQVKTLFQNIIELPEDLFPPVQGEMASTLSEKRTAWISYVQSTRLADAWLSLWQAPRTRFPVQTDDRAMFISDDTIVEPKDFEAAVAGLERTIIEIKSQAPRRENITEVLKGFRENLQAIEAFLDTMVDDPQAAIISEFVACRKLLEDIKLLLDQDLVNDVEAGREAIDKMQTLIDTLREGVEKFKKLKGGDRAMSTVDPVGDKDLADGWSARVSDAITIQDWEVATKTLGLASRLFPTQRIIVTNKWEELKEIPNFIRWFRENYDRVLRDEPGLSSLVSVKYLLMLLMSEGNEPTSTRQGGANVSGTDRAMDTVEPPVGGIDLNSANLNLQIKRDGNGVPLPLAQQDIAQLESIEGFEPIILEIQPVPTNPPVLSKVLTVK